MKFINYFLTHGRAFSRVALLAILLTAFVWLLVLSFTYEAVGVPTVFVGMGIVYYLTRQYNKFKDTE